MLKRYFAVPVAAAFLAAACGNNANQSNASNGLQTAGVDSGAGAAQSNLPPVETRQPSTDLKPAFVGQTRVAGARTGASYNVSVLSSELKRPWDICALPDGRFLITEKAGVLRIATAAGQVGPEITGLPKVNAGGQGGLLGVTIDPDFSQNRMVYWTFSEDVDGGTLTSVAKGKLSSDERRIENPTVIYRATPAYDGRLHYGSRIVFDGSGNLFVSTGERSDKETRPQSQWVNSSLGKILYITKDGKQASTKAPVNQSNARPEIYSYGHRNVQGLAVHPTTGELWSSEMGPQGGDELNRIHGGKNYGWPDITYGEEYSGATIGKGIAQKEGMEQPVYYWDPVLSPSGMTFYDGDAMREWKNNLFICGLNSQHIARLVIENNKVVGEERIAADQNQRFRDIAQGNDGALYAVTDDGKLYRIGK